MGLFDFPRINFRGNVDINVPTINNSYYFPLTIYDQTRSEPLFPPRLYFSSRSKIDEVKAKVNPTARFDDRNGYWYIEIEAINTIPLLRTWCMKPICSDTTAPDFDYLPYYRAAERDLGVVENTPALVGMAPGYWNMYGDMGVSMRDVHVTGVQVLESRGVKTWTIDSNDPPTPILSLLRSSVDLDSAPGNGRTTAIMAETISSQSIYASIFCSNVNLYETQDKGKLHFNGRPGRFSTLIYAAWRVVNWIPPMGGSARWNACIPLDQMNGADRGALHELFAKYRSHDNRELKGVFVSFTTHAVFENRYDQSIYASGKPVTYPAQGETIGSITPWYADDMMTMVPGRNLLNLNMSPIFFNKGMGNPIPVCMTPATARLHKLADGRAIFSVDMGNSWPETMTPGYQDGKVQPAKRGEAVFETMNLGRVSFRYGKTSATDFAWLDIDPVKMPLAKAATMGCIFDTVIQDPALVRKIEENFIQVHATVNSKEVQILQESPYMFLTDQKGLYAEVGDDPEKGFIVNDDKKIPCTLRIFQKGKPVKTPIEVLIAKYKVPEAANDPLAGPDRVYKHRMADGDIVKFEPSGETLKNAAVYYFVYEGQYKDNKIPVFSTPAYTIQDTGAFACIRLYPKKDYSRYLDPRRHDYTPPTYEVVYEEVFKLYDVAYPSMALVHPFSKDTWDNGIMAGLTVQRTDPAKWSDILYMSRSRELNPSQRALLVAWAKTYADPNLPPVPAKPKPEPIGIPKYNIHLKEFSTPVGMPLVQSCAWAAHEGKLLLIGGLIEGFHGLNQDEPIFGQQFTNRTIWVVDLAKGTSVGLHLTRFGPYWDPLCSANMQFLHEGNMLYIAGGYGPKTTSDKESDTTFDTFMAFDVPALIKCVETQTDPVKALKLGTRHSLLKVAGGKLFKEGDEFYLAFGQDYSGAYAMGKTGQYTGSIRMFRVQGENIVPTGNVTDANLHRRDLNAVKILTKTGHLFAGLGGVFDHYNDGYTRPVLFNPAKPEAGVKLDPLSQVTDQYTCAKITVYDTDSDACIISLLGGIGQYQYHSDSRTWENGDDGAKLPFVRSITHIVHHKNKLSQRIQLPPSEPEMPGLLGANAIFIPDESLLIESGVIDYRKIKNKTKVIGLMYGGILSTRPTSSEIYPTSVNKVIYQVVLTKED